LLALLGGGMGQGAQKNNKDLIDASEEKMLS